jgi:hypothetical protein
MNAEQDNVRLYPRGLNSSTYIARSLSTCQVIKMEFVHEPHPFDVHTNNDSGVDSDPNSDDDAVSVDEMDIGTPRKICGREYAAQDIVLKSQIFTQHLLSIAQ